MNKLFLRLAVLAVVASASMLANAADEVRLISSRSYGCPPVSGCWGTPFFQSVIEVQNLAYDKQVGIRYKAGNGEWLSAPAQYMGPSSTGRELWKVSLTDPAASFAAYLTVNGITYWDNNASQNYAVDLYRYDALLGSSPLGDPLGNWGPPEPGTSDRGAISGNLLIKNLGYYKTVKIVYTQDRWATKNEAFASYQATLPSGVELWQFALPTAARLDQSQVEMAFQYIWDGGSAWDNNFGRNYRLNSIILR